jgi:hypothetical protein
VAVLLSGIAALTARGLQVARLARVGNRPPGPSCVMCRFGVLCGPRRCGGPVGDVYDAALDYYH